MSRPAASFAELLRHHRAAASLTQEELAERANLSSRAISDLERGIKHRPYPHTVRQLVLALRLDPEEATHFQSAARQFRRTAGTQDELNEQTKQRISLPMQPTSFIGRQKELKSLRTILCRNDVRLLTLTGPGGVGKTRLGLRAAEAAVDLFPDGVVFVSLGSLADPDRVPAAIANTLGLRELTGQSLLQVLTRHFQSKKLLLMLDTFEHLLPASDVISHLLLSCPQLRLLVTSRAVLHLAAEHEFPVPALVVPTHGHLPELESLSRYDAVQLFVRRARALRPGFGITKENASAVAEICAQLDGLPLAIELAAARIKLFSPQALLERLSSRLALLTSGASDVPVRQQTLRKTIDWSYSLLGADEQILFARLSVFAGGSTFAAIEAVCNLEGQMDVLAGTTALIEQSLLRVDGDTEPRLVMLETLLEYATERFKASGDAPTFRQRHAEVYLRLAETARTKPSSPDRVLWLERLEREHDNLRAALSWSLQQEDSPELALSLTGSLAWFWIAHWHLVEGRRWLEQSLALNSSSPAAAHHRQAFAKALTGISQIAIWQDDFVAARNYAEQSVALWRSLHDTPGLGEALLCFGLAAQHEDLDLARTALEEAVALHPVFAAPQEMIQGLDYLGRVELRLGNLRAARARFGEALSLSYRTADTTGVVHSQLALAEVALTDHDRAAARTLLDDAHANVRNLREAEQRLFALDRLAWVAARQGAYDLAALFGDKALSLARSRAITVEGWWRLGWALTHRGDTARCQSDLEQAAALYDESLRLFREHGHRQGVAAVLHNLGLLALERQDTAGARELLTQSLALFEDLGFGLSIAACVAALAGVVAQEGHPEWAALLYGAAEAAREETDRSGALTEPANKFAWDREVVAAQREMDVVSWEKAWSEGRTLSLDEALARANLMRD